MIYPAYVHLGDKQRAHGVTLPDFEGCHTAVDGYTDLPKTVQEAVELHCEGKGFDDVPDPTGIAELENTGEYSGGVWMLIDIDLSRIDNKPQRLNVSLPGYIVRRMDTFANKHHLTRSALIVKAVESYMKEA